MLKRIGEELAADPELGPHILQPLINVFNDVLKWLHNDVGLRQQPG